ncbi:uncharacterized protein LOC111897203 [Lactuca sativa]|uniref:uncharacterized protein LOC111897203 n=1 Tax=Lactuca sativa TaxID=4236 RepID=UPI001C68AD9F|nr:uncharacterized protein LOC111897203 [Lactuca sativa]
MTNIADISMGAYKKWIRDNAAPGLDHEDAYKHLDEINDIVDYFNVPNVPREIVLLRMLSVTFKGAAKDWLKALPLGVITTWAQVRKQFLEQLCPPSKIFKLQKEITNFEQQPSEFLYEAWERYNGVLRNCPQNDLNIQQEVSIFYVKVNVMTRQLLDSQGPLTMKTSGEIKEFIEEFAKHSHEHHNPRNDGVKGIGGGSSEDIADVLAMLNNMDRRMTKTDQSIHDIRVGCERCNGSHFTKECHLDVNGNKHAQTSRGFYEKEQPPVEKKVDLQTMLNRFMEASEKRHYEINATIKDQRLMMKDQQAMMKDQQATMIDQQVLLRNHQASIQNLEAQLGQLTTLVNDKFSRKFIDKKTQSHVMVFETKEDVISEFLEALEVESK